MMCYIEYTKTAAHMGGLTERVKRNSALDRPKSWGGFSMQVYLQNIKMNVSNAIMKMPNCIKSLKSK